MEISYQERGWGSWGVWLWRGIKQRREEIKENVVAGWGFYVAENGVSYMIHKITTISIIKPSAPIYSGYISCFCFQSFYTDSWIFLDLLSHVRFTFCDLWVYLWLWFQITKKYKYYNGIAKTSVMFCLFIRWIFVW